VSGKRILVLGGGFAGLWSAVGAARKLDELGRDPDAVAVTLVNRDAFHSIRVRNYESDLTAVRVPLDDVLGPIGVRRVEGQVTDLDLTAQAATVDTVDGPQALLYDRLVFALGSQLLRPPVPGLAEHGFDVDTYDGAAKLGNHLQSLPGRPESPAQFTVIVVGAGLTVSKRLPKCREDCGRSWPEPVRPGPGASFSSITAPLSAQTWESLRGR